LERLESIALRFGQEQVRESLAILTGLLPLDPIRCPGLVIGDLVDQYNVRPHLLENGSRTGRSWRFSVHQLRCPQVLDVEGGDSQHQFLFDNPSLSIL
jgi:hypothetical protein